MDWVPLPQTPLAVPHMPCLALVIDALTAALADDLVSSRQLREASDQINVLLLDRGMAQDPAQLVGEQRDRIVGQAELVDDGSCPAFDDRQLVQHVVELADLGAVSHPPTSGSAVAGPWSSGESAGLPSR
jgi:hypothetical protein